MDVYEAVTSRRAVRAFTDRLVPRETPERVVSAALWSDVGMYLKTVVLTLRAGGLHFSMALNASFAARS
jgi:nitroreductase